MIDKFLKAAAPIAAIAIASALAGSASGCKGNVKFDGFEGVPLDELDLTGEAPDQLTIIASPVRLVLKTGKSLKVTAQGEADVIDDLRFSRKDGMLAIGLDRGNWRSDGTTVINVTMPAPRKIVFAGAGTIDAAEVADEAEVSVLSSGSVTIKKVAAKSLDLNIMGPGNVEASGKAENIDLNIAGSGSAEMAGLTADKAKVTIAGSGSSTFASDGTVKAKIVGSGNVRVIGRADCEVSSMGSGSLKCEAPAETAEKPTTKKKARAKKKPAKKSKD